MAKPLTKFSSWIQVAPPPLISPSKSSNSPHCWRRFRTSRSPLSFISISILPFPNSSLHFTSLISPFFFTALDFGSWIQGWIDWIQWTLQLFRAIHFYFGISRPVMDLGFNHSKVVLYSDEGIFVFIFRNLNLNTFTIATKFIILLLFFSFFYCTNKLICNKKKWTSDRGNEGTCRNIASKPNNAITLLCDL